MMTRNEYFFCGIGGSGMLPLAMYLRARGHKVSGSDRSFDQGRLPELAARIAHAGITLHPQDGSGIIHAEQVLVTSSAVEAKIPDVVKAGELGCPVKIRAEILSSLLNEAEVSCGIAGTSGKSTTTSMLAHILTTAGKDPSVVNGAPMLNTQDVHGTPQGWRCGDGPTFVCEVDESDGSIARYNPAIGVVLNVSEDHKSMDELEVLFRQYAERSGGAIVGVDSAMASHVASGLGVAKVTTFSIHHPADYMAFGVERTVAGVSAMVQNPKGEQAKLSLPMVGAFNIGNALAAIAASAALGVDMKSATAALSDFAGSARRLQKIGTVAGVTVIDDFAHNPEKIKASIEALTHHYDRLHILYQPHGYGPLQKFRELYEAAFASCLRRGDRLFVTEPAYFGGTVTKTDDAHMLAKSLNNKDRQTNYIASRDEVLPELPSLRAGDAFVVMGARDDTLSDFAKLILSQLDRREQ